MNRKRLLNITRHLKKARVLVIGDIILDEFIWGDVSRISPEAPVPVVEVRSQSYMPGGAANVISNIRSLGGWASAVGVIGKDEAGKVLRNKLGELKADISGTFIDKKRPTSLKTRIVAHNQQVVRIDKERAKELGKPIYNKLIQFIKRTIPRIDAVILEDYGKGVVTAPLVNEVVWLARKFGKVVSVDPKEENFFSYKGITVITPNHHEAGRALGITIKDKKTLYQAGKEILERLGSQAVLITLGENGMCLFECDGRITHIPTVAKEVYDVSGAGDTVIAVLAMALGSKASMLESAYLSNFAAGIVVGKVGIGIVSPEELKAVIKDETRSLSR
jgi:D-beta-D-heptose 7-phosphate kinase/D-beta-D-heptose 1-phosphate adenosyltransferase